MPATKSATALKAPKKAVPRKPETSSDEIRDELLKFWRPRTNLTLDELREAFDNGNSLADVGIEADTARKFVNKYNKIIGPVPPAAGPRMTQEKAEQLVSVPMKAIVKLLLASSKQ